MKSIRAMLRTAAAAAVSCAAGLLAPPAQAEPYLAVRMGAKCTLCHVNPTGGGKRNDFGALYGSASLAAGRLEAIDAPAETSAESPAVWAGRINRYLSLGADARINLDSARIPNEPDTLEFRLRSAQLYLDLQLVPGRLSLYVDERVAPGNAVSREAFAMLWSRDRSLYLKAGRIFLPYGLRIEDDSAFIRQASGVSFNVSDDGVEGGFDSGPWSAAMAVTNGAAGGAETNQGKQVSVIGSFNQPDWRAGGSYSWNKGESSDRRMGNVFGGLRTGPIAWLGEIDRVVDTGPAIARREQRASLVEANLEIGRGQNLKITYEHFDPDRAIAEDERERYSLVWELVPFQHTQFRAGYRDSKAPPQNNAQNANELFAQWHLFF